MWSTKQSTCHWMCFIVFRFTERLDVNFDIAVIYLYICMHRGKISAADGFESGIA